MSYTQLLYHIVFRTKHSRRTLPPEFSRDLYNYLWGIAGAQHCKLYRINGMEDHIHLLISLPTNLAVADFLRDLKANSSKWLRENPRFPHFDGWNEGYAALTYCLRDIDMVGEYIKNQQKHHTTITSREEYRLTIEDMGLTMSSYEKFEDA